MPTYTDFRSAARDALTRIAAPTRRFTAPSWALLLCAAMFTAAGRTAAAQPAPSAEPRSYAALWQAAMVAVDAGEFERNEAKRKALYASATDYAKQAIALNPGDAEGHFHLSRALGRTALALGPRDRVTYGIAVREHALEALRLAPRHPGALHVMGVWHTQVMRLNGLSRTVAKAFLGGQVFGSASWTEAVRYLELAVQIEPSRLVHRLDLARVYRDVGRTADAKAAYRAAIACPTTDANDATYRAQAEAELRALR